MAAEHSHGAPSHAVVGLPGAVDYEAGRFLWAPNLPAQWPDQLSADGLSAQLGLPVSIANDADLAAVGEAWFGAGATSPAVAYLTISTGIGAGVVNGGRVLRGTRSLAEVGHVVIDWRAWRDGAPSTVEELGSGSGVARLARRGRPGRRSAHKKSRPARRRASHGRSPSGSRPSPPAPPVCRTWSCPSTRAPSSSVVGMGRQDEFFGPLRDMVLQRPGHHPDDLTDRPLHPRRRCRAVRCGRLGPAATASQ